MFLHRTIRKIKTILGSTYSHFNFKLGGGRCGPGTTFSSGLYVSTPRRVSIGNNCYIGRNVRLVTELPQSELVIGDNVQINDNVLIDYTGGLTISNDSLISDEVIIYTHCHGYDPRSKPEGSELSIESGAWIGIRSVILTGCNRIGKLTIIGACSVITKDLRDGEIVAGVPAKTIGTNPRLSGGHD